MIRNILLVTLLVATNTYGTANNFNHTDIRTGQVININQLLASQHILIQKNFELAAENTQLKQEIQKMNMSELNQNNRGKQLIKDFSYMFAYLFADVVLGASVGVIIAQTINKNNR